MWWMGDPEGYPEETWLVVFVSGEVMREVRGRVPETACGKNSENVSFEWGEKLHFVEPKTAKSYILLIWTPYFRTTFWAFLRSFDIICLPPFGAVR